MHCTHYEANASTMSLWYTGAGGNGVALGLHGATLVLIGRRDTETHPNPTHLRVSCPPPAFRGCGGESPCYGLHHGPVWSMAIPWFHRCAQHLNSCSLAVEGGAVAPRAHTPSLLQTLTTPEGRGPLPPQPHLPPANCPPPPLLRQRAQPRSSLPRLWQRSALVQG